jgi:hypothetical protein
MNDGKYGLPHRAETYRTYDPFCPPLSPSSLNDEFDVDGSGSGAPPGFVSVATLTPTYATRKGKLVLTSPAATGTVPSAIEKPLPAGPFTVMAHAVQLSPDVYGVGGVYVRRVSTNKRASMALFFVGPFGNGGLTVTKFSNFTSRDSFTDYFFYDRMFFIRLTSNGTTLHWEYSYDGAEWVSLYSEALATHFGTDLPDAFGIELRSENSGAVATMGFEMLRYAPAFRADLGRMVTREIR